jgi:phosphonate transport system permease protein
VIRGFQYSQTAAVLIMLVVAVSAIDLVSSTLRKRVI